MSASTGPLARRAGARAISALAFSVGLLNVGCVLGNGVSCNNADVKTSIAEDALTSLAETVKQPISADQLAAQLQDYTLHDTFEVSREGSVTACRGTLGSLKGIKGLPDYPLDYTITKSDDGHVMYAFDKVRFGPALLSLIVMQGMAAQAKKGEQDAGKQGATPRAQQEAPATPRPMPYAADPNWSQWGR